MLRDTQLRAERTFDLDPNKLHIGVCDNAILYVRACLQLGSKFTPAKALSVEQRNLSIADSIRAQLSVLHREVSLIQR